MSIVVEVIAFARHRPAPRLGAAFSVQQQFAAGLIGAITLLFLAPASVAAAAGPSAAGAVRAQSSVSVAPAQASTPTTAGTSSATSTARTPKAEPVLYTVQPGDSLWSVAEAHLGDGNRYSELAALNSARVQPDGDHLDDSHWLRPGWVLELPADAGAKVAPAGGSRVVAAGESLWSIADGMAGPGATNQEVADLAEQIVEHSRGLQQPGGARLQDPNVILPGWTLAAADTTADTTAVTPAAPAPAAPAPSSAAPSSASTTTPQPSSSTAANAPGSPTAPQATASAPAPTTGATTSAPVTAASGAASTTDPAEEAAWPLRTVGGVGALLAAGVLSLLAARRARQQRRRRPGQRIAMPSPQDEITELELRAVENPHAVQQVDTALRGLALWLHENDRPLPALNLARLAADRFQLHLAEPTQLPAPWRATGDPTVWALACDPEDPDALYVPQRSDGTAVDADLVAQVPAPYPSLVVIGQDLDGTHVLLDLEQLVAISINGDVTRSEQVLRALAVELATSTWADDLRVSLVDCCEELPEALGSLRVRHLRDVEELLRDLEAHSRSTAQLLQRDGVKDVAQARAQHVATEAAAPEIVLLATPISDEQRDRLDRVLGEHPRLGIAAVTAGAAADIDSWTLTLDDPAFNLDPAAGGASEEVSSEIEGSGTATLEELSLRIVPQRIDDAEYASILNLLRATTASSTDEEVDAMPAERHVDDLPPVIVLPLADFYSDLPHASIDLREIPAHAGASPTGHEAAATAPLPAGTEQDVEHDVLGDVTAHGQEVTEPPQKQQEAGTTHLADADPASADPASADPASADPASAALTPASDLGEDTPGATVQRLHPPLLRVLGTVDVINTHGQVPDDRGRLGRGLELAILLAFFPGLDHRGVDAKLSPNRPIATATRNKWSWAIRKLLGTDENGDDYIPKFSESTGFRYHLHPAVRTDWDVFSELAADRSTASKVKALRLVRGAPFSGIDPRRYTWSEGLHQEIVSTIVDVAFEVAERALASGNPELAREASAIGRLAEPGSQVLWRATLRADYLLGELDALAEHAERLSESNDDDLEPETTQLLGELLQGPAARASAQ
ncbi:hypothetical protein GCM10027586_02040 [Kineococcus gypseus]